MQSESVVSRVERAGTRSQAGGDKVWQSRSVGARGKGVLLMLVGAVGGAGTPLDANGGRLRKWGGAFDRDRGRKRVGGQTQGRFVDEDARNGIACAVWPSQILHLPDRVGT